MNVTTKDKSAFKAGTEIKYFIGNDMAYGWVGNQLCWTGFTKDPKQIHRNFPTATLSPIKKKKSVTDWVLYGTPFQISVWKEILTISEGKTCTYQDIAKKIKNPKAVRAVGSAVGSNPISLFIPCHRVLSKTGRADKYGWGPAQKRKLLKSEGIEI